MSEFGRPLPARRRATPIPVPPPRIPTPMPPSNNNNPASSLHSKDPNQRIHPSSVGSDIPKLITKASYKLLDNDVKTAWINPRLISKIDLEVIKSTEYVPPPEHNMNGHYSHLMSHQNQSCGRSQREWESAVNGRAKSRSVPAPTAAAADAIIRRRKPSTKPQMEANTDRLLSNNRGLRSKTKSQRQKVKGVVGYQSATACYVGGGSGGGGNDSAVYGVYSETKYTFAVNGMPGTAAQASAAAAFFAR